MNLLNKYSIAAGLLLFSSVAMAQDNSDPSSNMAAPDAVNKDWKPSLVKDGAIDAVPHVNRSLEQNPIREIDVAWKRRVWREIDTRVKQNEAFVYRGDEYTGGGAFIEILIDAIKKGKVPAYSSIDDRFTAPLNMEAFEKTIGGAVDSIKSVDPDTGEEIWQTYKKEFNVYSVTRFRIKEDWIFDRNVGRMVVRIVGIAPLQDIMSETGVNLGKSAMFWLNYDQLRKVLANYEVYNPLNDIHRMTWADYFDGRYFASYVIKTSADNPSGRDYEKGLRGLEAGEEAMEAIREKEDDMWQR